MRFKPDNMSTTVAPLIDGERNTEMLVPRKSFDLENYEEWFNLPILIVVFTTAVIC